MVIRRSPWCLNNLSHSLEFGLILTCRFLKNYGLSSNNCVNCSLQVETICFCVDIFGEISRSCVNIWFCLHCSPPTLQTTSLTAPSNSILSFIQFMVLYYPHRVLLSKNSLHSVCFFICHQLFSFCFVKYASTYSDIVILTQWRVHAYPYLRSYTDKRQCN